MCRRSGAARSTNTGSFAASLEYLRGDADTSVMNQVYGLAWHTAVFRTLNEARRMEQDHPVNGPMWELLTTGYANIMTLGIRKLVDKHPDTDSVWNVIAQIERRPQFHLPTLMEFALPCSPEPIRHSHARVRT